MATDQQRVVDAFKQQLGERIIFIYGDSIAEELGRLFFGPHGIKFENGHGNMRGATPERINEQVLTPRNELTDDTTEKLQRSSLIILSAGKNVMHWKNSEQIAIFVI